VFAVSECGSVDAGFASASRIKVKARVLGEKKEKRKGK
jgi:hypothetical protein